MNCKKGLSLILALALVFSPLSALGTVAYAEDNAAGNAIVEEVEEKELTPTSTPADPETSENGGVENVSDGNGGSEDADNGNSDGEEAGNGNVDSEDADNGNGDGEDADNGNSGGEYATMPLSLQPLQSSYAYIYLNDVSVDDLKNYSVKDFRENLVDGLGEQVIKDPDAIIAWGTDSINYSDITQDFEILDNEGTVDLTYYGGKYDFENMMLVGTGSQLDENAIRYTVQVSANETLRDSISFSFHKNDGSLYHSQITQAQKAARSSLLDGIAVTGMMAKAPDWADYTEGETCYLSISSTLASSSRKNSKVEVYPLDKVQEYLENGETGELTGAVTEQVLNVYSRTTYSGTFTLEEAKDPAKGLCIVYTNADGKVLAYQGFTFVLTNEDVDFSGGLYANEEGEMVAVDDPSERSTGGRYGYSLSCQINVKAESARPAIPDSYYSTSNYWYSELVSGRSADDAYYYVMEPNAMIEKIVLGSYANKSYADASKEGAQDITAEIMPTDKSTVPYGYKAVYKLLQPVYITVFYKDGTSAIYRLYATAQSTGGGGVIPPPDDDISTDLTMQGVKIDGGATYSTSAPYSNAYLVNSTALDSLAYNGYQLLLLLNDEELKLGEVHPLFDADPGAQVFNSKNTDPDKDLLKRDGTGPAQDHSKEEPVQYLVRGNKGTANYFVTVAQKTKGAKLFVNNMLDEDGDPEREVFIVKKRGDQHNVLVANLGGAPLTELKAELVECTDNIALDDYWTFRDGDTLKPFTGVENGVDANGTYRDNGYLPNLAQVRIVSVGTGPIEGTLHIEGKDETGKTQEIDIHLTGMASNPQIVTDKDLKAGVKFVPYSQTIATDNAWGTEGDRFSIVPDSGRLPDGLTLIPETGEIYGVPKEVGTFKFKVQVTFGLSELFEPSDPKEFTLEIKENTDDNVYGEIDGADYALTTPIGKTYSGGGIHEYVLQSITGNELFVSKGEMDDFVDFWLNGEKLTRDKDYTVKSGSTEITILAQTLQSAPRGVRNTIAAEFRAATTEGGAKELKRTAQNFYIPADETTGGSSGDKDTSDKSESSGNTGGNTAAGSGTAAAAPAAQPQYATLTVRVVDANGAGLSGLTVELHSAPRSGRTNASGYVTFSNVPFGAHTIYVKNASGTTLASHSFVFSGSTTVGISGGTVLAAPGGALNLTVRLNGNALSFVSAVPQTGDDFDPALYMTLVLCSAAGLLGLAVWRKRRAQTR